MDTLGSNLAKSATDLLIVGIPSMAALSKNVPVPTLIRATPLEAVTTTSSRSDDVESKSMLMLVVSLRMRKIPSTDAD